MHDQVAEELYKINTTAVEAINSTIQPVREWLQSSTGTAFLQSVPEASLALRELQTLGGQVQQVLSNSSFIEDAIEQSDFQTIFQVWV